MFLGSLSPSTHLQQQPQLSSCDYSETSPITTVTKPPYSSMSHTQIQVESVELPLPQLGSFVPLAILIV